MNKTLLEILDALDDDQEDCEPIARPIPGLTAGDVRYLKSLVEAGATSPVGAVQSEKCEKCNELARLLLEARDAMPAISRASGRLRNIDLQLARRIEDALEPWRIKEDTKEGR